MEAAVARLADAVQGGEIIGVFGDFDTDGLTATALLVKALEELGATAIPYLPDRTDEGHGLNPLAIGSLRGQGISLMITVVCGSSNVEEIELASALGIDTIVTDHHVLPPIQPPAIALVNPSRKNSRYPYGELTGAGLSYKLVEALWHFLGKGTPEHLMELAAIGTIADVGPLQGENRYLVKKGIENLNRTTNPGLKALIARAGLKLGQIDSESLSFSLIPRLNAAGRLKDAAAAVARGLEEPLLHLYNHVKESGRHILLTAKQPPARWGIVLGDLVSRLNTAVQAGIGAPDDALITAVLVKQFTDRQLKVDVEVITYMLTRMERSFDAARRMVGAIADLALEERRNITVPLVRRVLDNF